jgi:hypothetical protein
MNILSIPYISGGLSHFIPLYVLNDKLRKENLINNYFLTNKATQNFLMPKKIPFVPIDYSINPENFQNIDISKINNYVFEMEKSAINFIKPLVIIEDIPYNTLFHDIPKISITRTGNFRSIELNLRNNNHTHSIQKGLESFYDKHSQIPISNHLPSIYDTGTQLIEMQSMSKVKIIPGISSIECLPKNINDKESYFYSGPLLVRDRPSIDLSKRLSDFLSYNKNKKIVFITTGTVDLLPTDEFIEYFIKKNYVVITTCNSEINVKYNKTIFYKHLLPINFICSISSLVIHQCGSGMYHYPIMNKVPSMTIGTQCYDREDVALRLEELGVSGHIPHPEDNPEYWNIFLKLMEKFENNNLINYDMLDKLNEEINLTMANFNMEDVIQYAIS